MGRPSVYPTGVTIYDHKRTFNGYTLFQAPDGAMLIDMNGRPVKLWKGLCGFPNKLLPGGFVMGHTEDRSPKYSYQDSIDLVQVDWDGNIVWRFEQNEFITDPDNSGRWMARQHHDYQRTGSTTGYYYPGASPETHSGNTLILTHTNVRNPEISDKLLIDDRVIEVTWEGEIIWDWKVSDHFNELGFDGMAKNAIYRSPNMHTFVDKEPAGDYIHINSVSVLGLNRWFDMGDERFHPDNLILDSREANIIFIISKQTGSIVWRLSPDYSYTEPLRAIGQIIGQHHCHMIPKGLPGEGNILIFDNGGFAGYGSAAPGAPDGLRNARRHYSRVLELDPVSMELVWSFPAIDEKLKKRGGEMAEANLSWFYSSLVSSAQRLPNGNTLIDEGLEGRIIEVTPEGEIVWEYILPYTLAMHGAGQGGGRMLYRAYRYPYGWVPQLEKPVETDIVPPDNSSFHVSGSPEFPKENEYTTTLEEAP